MESKTLSTKEMVGAKVFRDKVKRKSTSRQKIGKIYRFVFHPTEKRVVGFTVKRPDKALMFKRDDMFVSLGGFGPCEDGILVSSDDRAIDDGAREALGIDWDDCVLWVGMPIMTKGGDVLGYVGDVRFDSATGAVREVQLDNSAAKDALLGKYIIPSNMILGFKRGGGMALAPMGEYGEPEEAEDLGAILVSDEALEMQPEGGAAAQAGKAAAVISTRTKQALDKAKPKAEEAGKKAEEAMYIAGEKIGQTSGMFASFKEEFEKAKNGVDDDDD